MRDTIENISLLQKQLNDLQLENQLLKNLLDQSGISYMQALKRLRTPETVTAYDPDQGARIIHPEVITPKMANEFSPLCSEGSAVTAVHRSDEVSFFGRSQQARVDRKEGVPIRSAKGHEPVAFAVLHGNMIKHPGTELCLLAAGPLKQAVVNYKRVDS